MSDLDLAALGVEDEELAAKISSAVSEHVNGLKTTNARLKQEKQTVAEKLANFDGVDPEEYKKLIEKASHDEEQGMIARNEFDKIMERKESQWNAQIGEANEKYSSLLESHKETILKASISSAVIESDGNDLLPMAISTMSTVVEHDGRHIAVAVEKDGKTVKLNDNGELMSLGELAAELRSIKKYAPLFNSTGLSGGGAPNSNGRAGGVKQVTRDQFEAMSPGDRAKFIGDGGTVV